MIYYTVCILLFSVMAGAMTFYAIKAGGNRPALVSIFCGLVFFGLAVSTDILGYPKPLWLEWRSVEGIPVISMYPDRASRTVYLWAVKDGIPKAYTIPWASDQQTASMQQQFREGQLTGESMYLSDDHRHYRFRSPAEPLTK